MDFPFADKLIGVKSNGDGSINCQCPICLDSGKLHLRIYKTLAFSCAANQGDKEHNRLIRNVLYDQVNQGDIDNWRESFGFQEEKIEITKVYPENLLDKLIKEYGYWSDRGIHEDVLEKIGGGVASIDEKSKLSGRYVMPCRNIKNQIIGFGGRLIVDNSLAVRWKLLGTKKQFIFPHSSISLGDIRQKESVILVEGMGCSLALANYNYWNGICLFGVTLSSSILSLLISQNVGKIFIATNNEKSGIGNAASEKIKNVLLSYFKEEDIIIHLPYAKDFLDMDKEQMEKWIIEYKRLKDNLPF